MSAMLEPGTDFTQPLAVAARVQAQLLFNRRANEDAGNFVTRRQPISWPTVVLQRRHHMLAIAGDQVQRAWVASNSWDDVQRVCGS